MKVILYSQSNNKLAIIAPASEGYINEIITRELSNTPYKIVDNPQIDPDFFDAYEFDQELGTKINISKAKEIQKDKFRQARKPVLEKLDVEYMRADEQGDTALKQQIAAQKQELRDVTNTPLPDDLEGIKNTWPSILDL